MVYETIKVFSYRGNPLVIRVMRRKDNGLVAYCMDITKSYIPGYPSYYSALTDLREMLAEAHKGVEDAILDEQTARTHNGYPTKTGSA